MVYATLSLQKDRVVVEAAEHYLALAHRLQREELPYGTAWRDVESYREKLVANKEYSWINFREQKVRAEPDNRCPSVYLIAPVKFLGFTIISDSSHIVPLWLVPLQGKVLTKFAPPVAAVFDASSA